MPSECPECGDDLYHHTPGVPTLFCDSCEQEYWQEAGQWFSSGMDGVITRV